MPEGEVLVLVNATDKQVRNAHTCLWTQCAYEVLHKKGMAGQQRGMAEQVEFPCLGATRGAEDGAEEVGEPGSTEPSEVMERRDLPRGLGGIKRQWTERRTPLQSQDGLQSCFCFAVNVTGRYLTVPRGSGWIYFFFTEVLTGEPCTSHASSHSHGHNKQMLTVPFSSVL